MNDNDFIRQQQAAVERMREFNSRSAYKGNTQQPMPPVPPFVKVPGANRQNSNYQQQPQNAYNNDKNQGNNNNSSKKTEDQKSDSNGTSIFDGLSLPFLDRFKKDGDLTLIIGLLLILLSEKADKKLLFALIYILL